MATKKFKDFTPKIEETTDEEAREVGFSLYGETFVCAIKEFQGYKMLYFSNLFTSEQTHDITSAVLDFFKYVLSEEDHKRIEDIFNHPTKIVEIETIMEIVNYVLEEFSDRDDSKS